MDGFSSGWAGGSIAERRVGSLEAVEAVEVAGEGQ
jgi:hypothetical protein